MLDKKYDEPLRWLDTQHQEMVALVERWASINSGSSNLEGLAKMRSALRASFFSLQGTIEEVFPLPIEGLSDKGNTLSTPLGSSLWIKKRTAAPRRVLLAGHMDTVFGKEHHFQTLTELDDNRLQGPGVADMKGGIVVMLKALEAFERSPMAKKIGWQVFINADEELGSPGSSSYLKTLAATASLGLIFEPSLPNGSFASWRMGSANFVVSARGVPAHVGRDFEKGANAISAIAHFVVELQKMQDELADSHFNVGQIQGGIAPNVVPDFASCKINFRAKSEEKFLYFKKAMQHLIHDLNEAHPKGAMLKLHQTLCRPPKLFDEKHQNLFNLLSDCGDRLGIKVNLKGTGGVCDGNTLAAAGLPTIDTLGVCGEGLHTDGEFMYLDSLVKRAKLACLLMMRFAEGESSL